MLFDIHFLYGGVYGWVADIIKYSYYIQYNTNIYIIYIIYMCVCLCVFEDCCRKLDHE